MILMPEATRDCWDWKVLLEGVSTIDPEHMGMMRKDTMHHFLQGLAEGMHYRVYSENMEHFRQVRKEAIQARRPIAIDKP